MNLGNPRFQYSMIPLKSQHFFKIVLQGSKCNLHEKLQVVFLKFFGCEVRVDIHLLLEEIQFSLSYFTLPNRPWFLSG